MSSLGWLRRDGEVLSSLEIAYDRASKRRGLLGRDGVDGALLLSCRSVHTFGMRFPIDVAFCERAGTDALVVSAIRTLPPGRVTAPRLRAATVIEAEAGTFDRWGLELGHELVVERCP